jgi:hypothetical protein
VLRWQSRHLPATRPSELTTHRYRIRTKSRARTVEPKGLGSTSCHHAVAGGVRAVADRGHRSVGRGLLRQRRLGSWNILFSTWA